MTETAHRRPSTRRHAARLRAELTQRAPQARDQILDALAALETVVAPLADAAHAAAPHVAPLPPPFEDAGRMLAAVHAMRALVQAYPRRVPT